MSNERSTRPLPSESCPDIINIEIIQRKRKNIFKEALNTFNNGFMVLDIELKPQS